MAHIKPQAPFVMDKPLPLITASADGRKFTINEEAKKCLLNIDKPMSVVAIVGKYRTGKSYLMNRLYGKNSGFDLGSTVQSKTKGIWIWARPHPRDSNRYMLLIDTEGLYDVEKGDSTYDTQLFTLVVLLCNCFVYNSQGTIDADAIRKLHLVAELTEHIKVQAGNKEETGKSFSKYFPQFIWVVRDFALQLEIDGRACPSDEYLEYALQLKKGKSRAVFDFNAPRECIRTFFPQRKCFVLQKPVEDEALLHRLDQAKDSDIRPGFLREAQRFCEAVWTGVGSFTVQGSTINGRRYVALAETYVQAINAGAVPCIGTAVETMMQVECQRALEESMKHYRKTMENNTVPNMPLFLHELSSLHEQANEEALRVYKGIAVFDTEGNFQTQLQTTLGNCYRVYTEKNWQASIQKCDLLLKSLVQESLKPKLDEAAFSVPGGYEKYKGEIDTIVKKFEKSEGKGPAAEELLAKFLADKQDQEEAILAADKAITKIDRERAEQKEEAKRHAANAAAMSRKIEKLKQQLVDAESSTQTKIDMMQEKFEKTLKENDAYYKTLLTKTQAEHEERLKTELKTQAQVFLKSTIKTIESQLAKLSKQTDEAEDVLVSRREENLNATMTIKRPNQQTLSETGTEVPEKDKSLYSLHEEQNKLCLRLKDEIPEGKFRDIKQMFHGYLGRCELDKMVDFHDLFLGLYDHGIIALGEYKKLSEAFHAVGLQRLGKEIEKTSETIRNIRISAINEGAVPCVQSAVTVMKKNECERAIDLATAAYMGEMDDALGNALPVDIDVLSKQHKSAFDSAVKLYHANATLDFDSQYKHKLLDTLNNCHGVFTKRNWQASVQKCDLLLKALVQESLKPKLDKAAFSVPGGYEKYRGEIDTIVKKYEKSEGKGPASEELLAKFLADKQDQKKAILAGDEAITKMDRERAEQKEEAKRQAAVVAAKSREIEMLKQRLVDTESSMQTMAMMQDEFEKKRKETEAGYKPLLEGSEFKP